MLSRATGQPYLSNQGKYGLEQLVPNHLLLHAAICATAFPTATYLSSNAFESYFWQVLIKKERQDVAPLEQPPAGAPAGVKCYKATFKPAIKKGTSQEFDVVATITGVFKPNPAKIEQTEKQYVEYLDNLYLLSPYTVQTQTTVVSMGCAGALGKGGGPDSCAYGPLIAPSQSSAVGMWGYTKVFAAYCFQHG